MSELPDPSTFMRRAMALAMRGRGAVEPNPMVGCVIAREGRILGEGWHKRFGGPHAEREALAACAQDPRGATAYVTLEPCCHKLKKTGPCVPALLEAGLARVVVACVDPYPAVAGRGIEQLRQAGIGVEVGLLEAEAKQLNAAFFAQVVHHRPYVTLKWAQSADGFVAGAGGRRVQISGEASMRAVHGLRGRSDAILVGINTVLADAPLLTARGAEGARPLVRVVLDSALRMPVESGLAASAKEISTAVYCSTEAMGTQRAEELGAYGVEVRPVQQDAGGRLALAEVIADLGRRGMTHLLVEPGPTLAGSFLSAGLADRVWVFRSPKAMAEPGAPRAADVRYPEAGSLPLGADVLSEYLNPRSEVFFAAAESADLVMARAGGHR